MSHLLQSLQQKRIGLALSGGAARGLAHIGVIKALEALGIRPTVVCGTSVGSLIGCAIAAGRHSTEIAEMARSTFWPRLLNGRLLEQFCFDNFPETFANLKFPFAAIATALPRNEMVALSAGDLSSAISASCALRLLRRPVLREGLRLKDGGFSCVLPAVTCRELGAEFVISSDVWEWSSAMRSLGQSPTTSTRRLYPNHYRKALSYTNLHIHPEIPASGYLPNAAAVDRMISAGERATYQAFHAGFAKVAA